MVHCTDTNYYCSCFTKGRCYTTLTPSRFSPCSLFLSSSFLLFFLLYFSFFSSSVPFLPPFLPSFLLSRTPLFHPSSCTLITLITFYPPTIISFFIAQRIKILLLFYGWRSTSDDAHQPGGHYCGVPRSLSSSTYGSWWPGLFGRTRPILTTLWYFN